MLSEKYRVSIVATLLLAILVLLSSFFLLSTNSAAATIDANIAKQILTLPGSYKFVVPNGVVSITVDAWGGGGGGGNESYGIGSPPVGGGGGFATKIIPVTPGESLTVVVGAGGSPATGSGCRDNRGAKGGGASYIQRGNEYLVVAAGGGGAGASGADGYGGSGGASGGDLGADGTDGNAEDIASHGRAGKGGSLSSGGAGGQNGTGDFANGLPGKVGDSIRGGVGGYSATCGGGGGSGGGGYWGGGGGGSGGHGYGAGNDGGGGGGGGGSSFGDSTIGGVGRIPGKPISNETIGYGGELLTAGQPGKVVISWYIDSTPAATFTPLPTNIDVGLDQCERTLQPAQTKQGSYFGNSVATSGNVAVIGASGENSAYIFRWNGSKWVEEAKLKPTSTTDDGFGWSIAIDGDIVLVGASGDDSKGDGAGAVYVFHRNGAIWQAETKLIAADGAAGDGFGIEIALQNNLAFIGAYGKNSYTGSVYVFQRENNQWSQQTQLFADDASEGDQFGLSIDTDPNVVLIGARYGGDSNLNSGVAYVFRQQAAQWVQEAKLASNDGQFQSWFGSSVAIEDDLVLIGAEGDAGYEGAAYVYRKQGETWQFETKLLPSDIEQGHQMGRSIVLTGNLALIGGAAGPIYGYRLNGTQWSGAFPLGLSCDNYENYFSSEFAVTSNIVLVGDSRQEQYTGAVYLYDMSATTNTPQSTPTFAPTPTPLPYPTEPNDTCETASPISVGKVYSATLSDNDVDYYRFSVNEPDRLLTIRLTHPNQDYDLTLYKDCPTDVGRARHVGETSSSGEELITLPIGPQTGNYVVKVAGHQGAHSETPYDLQVTLQVQSPISVRTLIVVNQVRLATRYGAQATEQLISRLNDLARHPSVQGIVLHIEDDPITKSFYADWDAVSANNAGDNVEQANRVAGRIKEVVQSYLKTYSGRRYVVLVGDDSIIPHYRSSIGPSLSVLDSSWVLESAYGRIDFASSPIGAALKQNHTLTDDFYADFRPAATAGGDLYVPDIAIGRLVETPAEMLQNVNAFIAQNGVLHVNEGLVAAYDFGNDNAKQICNRPKNSEIATDCSLLDKKWDAEQLRLLAFANSSNDIASLFAHANHYELVSATGNKLSATDAFANAGDLTGSFFYLIGCQAGLSVPPNDGTLPTQDWAQQFVGKGASYIGSTGWAYASDDGISYMERLMLLLTNQLVDHSSITIGDALLKAKEQYAIALPGVGGPFNYASYYDLKTLAATTLYGLPMLRLQLPTQQQSVSASVTAAEVDPPTVYINPTTLAAAQAAGEETVGWIADAQLPPDLSQTPIKDEGPFLHQLQTIVGVGSYFSATEMLLQANYPLQPNITRKFSDDLGEPRGILFEGGSYTDYANFDPVIVSANDTNFNTVSVEPVYSNSGWFPETPLTLNRVRFLDGTVNAWQISRLTGQYNQSTQTERLYNSLSYTLYYLHSTASALAKGDLNPPTIQAVHTESSAQGLRVAVTAVDQSGIFRTLATWTDGHGTWQSIDLVKDASGEWSGTIPVTGSISLLIQAIDNTGNVATDSNGSRYYQWQDVSYRTYLPLIEK